MKTFVLLKRIPVSPDCPPRFEWWEMCGEKLYNEGGGWNILISTDTIIETVKCKSWRELYTDDNIKKLSEYQDLVNDSTDKTLKLGWLSPEGKMHYCRYYNHIPYAGLILGKSVAQLEEQGWIHIYANSTMLYSKNRITQEQAKTAREELGLKVYDEDILYQ